MKGDEPGGHSGDLTRQTVSGFMWMLSGSGVQAVLRILVLVVLARLLTPNAFGVMGAALVIIGFSDLFSRLGMGPALVQRPQLEERHVRTAFTCSLLLGAVFGAVVFASADLVGDFFDFDVLPAVLRVISLSFPIRGLAVVAGALMERELRFRRLSMIQVASYGVGYGGTGLVMASLGFGVWALVAATLAQQGLSVIMQLLSQRHPKRPQLDRGAFRELMKFGGGFTIARLFNYAALQGDNVVAGRMLGSAALGLYGRAYQLLVFPVNLFSSVLDTVLFPSMARMQDHPRRLEAAFLRGVAAIALVFLPVSVMAMVLAPEVVLAVLGEQWTDVIDPFRVLAAGMLFRAGYKMSDSLARATGAVYRRAWRQGVYAVAVVAGAWVGQRWGLSGLAAGVLVALAINFVLMSHLSLRLTSMKWARFLAVHGPAAGVAAVALALTWPTATIVRGMELPAVATLALAAGVPASIMVVLAMLRPQLIGPDGLWMAKTLSSYFRNTSGTRRRGQVGEPTETGTAVDEPERGRHRRLEAEEGEKTWTNSS